MKNIIIILLLSVLASCSNSKIEKKNKTLNSNNIVELSAEQLKNVHLLTGKLEQKNISNILQLNGKIDVPPQNMISISVPLGGYLKNTKLLPGMQIRKGEVLALLEDQQYIQLQQEYLTTKAKLKFAQKEFERQRELNESKAGSDKIFQQSEADYTSMKIQLKALSEKLELIGINCENLNENTISRSVNLLSPINGYVSMVNFNIGKYVNPTDVLFELVNQSDIHLALTVFEKDLDKLFIGQKLFAYTNNNPDKKYLCEIILIGRVFSNERSVIVHCHFKNYDNSLIPGMYMNAEIELNTKDAPVLPSESIVNFEGKNYVFKKQGQRQFEMIEIKTGNSENGFIEIIPNKLSDKDSIVIKGAYDLLMALKNKEEEE